VFKPCVFFWSLLPLAVICSSVFMACSAKDWFVGGIAIACGVIAFLEGRADDAVSPKQRGLNEANRVLRHKTSPMGTRRV